MSAGRGGRRRAADGATLTGAAALALAGWLATGACAPGASDEAASAEDGMVTLHEPESPFVAFNIWVGTGSQNDPEGKEGLAALTAALLEEGSTESMPYQEVLERLYPMAAGWTSSVDKEMTVFRGVVHTDNLEEWYELFRAMLLEPAFSQEDFERIRSRTLDWLERGRRYQRDEELGKELLFWMAYAGTPYEHPEEGYVESVRGITLEDVREFYRTWYASNHVVVGIGGGFPEDFPERVREDFDALPQSTAERPPAPEPRVPDGVEALIVEKPTDATAISFGFPIDVLRGEEDYWPLMLANSWFGEHRNSFSHLYQVIRETRGMNYGDYSYIEAFPLGYTTQQRPVNYSRRSQLFEVWIRPISRTTEDDLHDRALFATRAAWRELERMIDEGLPREEVERTKNFLHNFAVTWGSTVLRRLSFAMDDAFYGLPEPGFLQMVRPELSELDAERVNAAIRRHLQHENVYLVYITADAEGMKEKLLAGTPTPIRYAAEQPPEVRAEDEEIAAYPIDAVETKIRILDIDEVFERGS